MSTADNSKKDTKFLNKYRIIHIYILKHFDQKTNINLLISSTPPLPLPSPLLSPTPSRKSSVSYLHNWHVSLVESISIVDKGRESDPRWVVSENTVWPTDREQWKLRL